ncbi:hypothetical protein VR45_32510, partial [Streptomyces sp. NRRL S-495]
MSLLGVAGCGRAEEVVKAAAAARSAGPDPLPGATPAEGPPTTPAAAPTAEPSPAPSVAPTAD